MSDLVDVRGGVGGLGVAGVAGLWSSPYLEVINVSDALLLEIVHELAQTCGAAAEESGGSGHLLRREGRRRRRGGGPFSRSHPVAWTMASKRPPTPPGFRAGCVSGSPS